MKTSQELLCSYYDQIKSIILDKQHPITGLLPASTAITEHGNYTDAWVRDNVYSILCVWGLSLALRKEGIMNSQRFELEQATVRLMRGLLRSMMSQADKVERFKSSLALHDALHAKYDTGTGNVVVGDHEWGHLQIDATSLFMLIMAQMIKSGLPIITSASEVDFVQNLVYYIERAYRTPDYGIWERGEKSNIGYVELNSSSLGMALAALVALDGFDLFGKFGSTNSRIHVLPDNMALCEITLLSILPRESSTKEIDAALLSIIGFPAFAVKEVEEVMQINHDIRKKLGGKYGYKRFLRDGHQTVLEDPGRHYYNEEELKRFENIECEWPLFLTYEMINALFSENDAEAEEFYQKIQQAVVKKNGSNLLPELFIVPLESVAAEKKNPSSQIRIPNSNVPLVWAQSLYFLSLMMREGLLTTAILDPIGLHLTSLPKKSTINILFLSESSEVQHTLKDHGVKTQTLNELPQNTFVCLPEEIAGLYSKIGKNKKLGLSGRPERRLKSLTTSRLFKLKDRKYICLSTFFLEKEFYLTFDSHLLVERLKNELSYINRHWKSKGHPVVALFFTQGLVTRGAKEFKELYDMLSNGTVGKISVSIAPFQELVDNCQIENMDEVGDHPVEHLRKEAPEPLPQYLPFSEDGQPLENEIELEIEAEENTDNLIDKLRTTSNLFEQVKILDNLVSKLGLQHKIILGEKEVSLRHIVEELYERAGAIRVWNVVRHAAALLGKVDVDLQSAVTSLLARQKIIQVGKAFSDESMIHRPVPFEQLTGKIEKFCRDDQRDKVLNQEVLVFLGTLIRSRPELFDDLITVRVSYIILLLIGELSRKQILQQEEAFEELLKLSPSRIQALIIKILSKYTSAGQNLQKLESMHMVRGETSDLSWHEDETAVKLQTPEEGWLVWRKSQGTFHKANKDFYDAVWTLFGKSKGIIIGDKLDRRNRLESRVILSDMTPDEKAFELKIEYLLNKIDAPEYRQITMEAMQVTALFGEQNPGIYIDDFLVFDIINGHAVRLAFSHEFPDLAHTYHDHKADAWTHFYQLSPSRSSSFMVKSILYLLSSVAQDQ